MASTSESEFGPVIIMNPEGQHQTYERAVFQAASRDFNQTNNTDIHFSLFKKRFKKSSPSLEDDQGTKSRPWFWRLREGPWSLENMDPLPVGRPNLKAMGRAYVYNMMAYELGVPCWNPRTMPPYIPEKGTNPGDVGIFETTKSFKFTKLYNIWDDAESISSTGLILSSSFPARDLDEPYEAIVKGDTPAYGAGRRLGLDQESTSHDAYTFDCHSSSGAVLVATSPVEAETLSRTSKHKLQKFIIENAAVLYGYASHLTHLYPREPIYFVTGCHKTETWAMACYHAKMPEVSNTLLLEKVGPPGVKETFMWTVLGEGAQTAVSHGGCRPGVKDQALFLEGFKLTANRMGSKAAEVAKNTFENNRGDSGSKGKGPDNGPPPPDNGPGEDAPPSGDSSGDGGRPGGKSSFFRSYSLYDQRALDLEKEYGEEYLNLVESLQTDHPSDFINEALLIEPGVNFALSHDDDWRAHLSGRTWNQDGLGRLIDKIEDYPISICGGVAFFPREDTGLPVDNEPSGKAHVSDDARSQLRDNIVPGSHINIVHANSASTDAKIERPIQDVDSPGESIVNEFDERLPSEFKPAARSSPPINSAMARFTRFFDERNSEMAQLARFFNERHSYLVAKLKKKAPSMTDPRDDDLVIILIGPTGSGKSSFIKNCFGKEPLITSGPLESCTQDFTWVMKVLDEDHGAFPGQRIVLIDTPDFDDTGSEYEILKQLSMWLADVYDQDKTVTGLVYLTSISKNRVTGSDKANCELFQRLCGKNALDKAVMATTHWDKALPAEALLREERLKATFWKDILAKGGHMTRVENPEDPSRIIDHILKTAKELVTLQIQEELVDFNKSIPKTEAGKKLRLTMEGLEELQKSQGFSSNPKAQEEAKQKEAYIENELLHLNPTGYNRLKHFFRSFSLF